MKSMDSNYTKLTKFEVLIEDLGKKIPTVPLTHMYAMQLIYDYDKLNDYGKVIIKRLDYIDSFSKYGSANLNDLKTKIDAAKDFVNHCREEYRYAYSFIFWALMILSVDETDKDEKLSLICDFASMLNIKNTQILDIIKVIKLIYGEKYTKSDFGSTKIKDCFIDILEMYGINIEKTDENIVKKNTWKEKFFD